MKSRKIDIFPKGLTHGFGPKIEIFPTFFLRDIRQKNVYHDILERKKALLGKKKTSSNSQNIDIFPKGLTHGFGPKIAIFPTFFLRNIRQKNGYYDIPGRLLAIKTKSSKSRKIVIFSKVVNPWFCSKNTHFSKFFF